MALRNYSSTAQRTTLSASATNVATTLSVTAVVGWPASTPYTLILDADTVNEEVVEVTNRVGTTLTVTRGVDGTSGVAHSSGATVQHGISARDLAEPNTHVNATTGAHGITGPFASTTDAQTLTNKTLTSPVVNTPTITNGTQSGTALSLVSVTNSTLTEVNEGWQVVASSTTGTLNVDALLGMNHYYTVASAAPFVLNCRGSGGTTLSSILGVGQSVTLTFLNTTTAATTSYPTSIQIDGTTVGVTTKWLGGTAPTTGNASSVDAYTLTILKTASTPTFTVFASQSQF